MSLIKVAAWTSNTEIKEKYHDDRGHWRKHKGKYIGGLLGGIPGIAIGALHFDKQRREKDFNMKERGEKKFTKHD